MTFCSCQCGGYYTACPFRANAWGICPYNVPHQDEDQTDTEEEEQDE